MQEGVSQRDPPFKIKDNYQPDVPRPPPSSSSSPVKFSENACSDKLVKAILILMGLALPINLMWQLANISYRNQRRKIKENEILKSIPHSDDEHA